MRSRVYLASAFYAVFCTGLQAQYQGINVRGDVGLSAGSQPGPGIYITLPLYYRTDYNGIHDAHGNDLLHNFNTDVDLLTVPAVAVTTPWKIAGASYGFSVVPAVLDKILNVAAIGAQSSPGFGFTDLFVQPVNLGWHTSHADFLAAYGFYAPTGGTSHGFDMWGHEVTIGTTLYADAEKKWRVSSAAATDFYQTKRSVDVKVGDILTLEGGAGRSFLKGAGSVGLAYVAQWKLTHDSGSGIPPALPITSGRAFGLGPEINMPVFARGKNIVLVGFRYIWELGATTNFQGQTLVASITFAHALPPAH